MSEEDLNAISQGIIGWISICQINGDPEKGNKDMEIILGELLKNSNQSKADPKWLWTKVKRKIGSYLTLSNESMQELRRQTWTTHRNLKDWFLAFKDFCLQYGFAVEGENDTIEFSDRQKRRIFNLDETNFSLDGSDGGRGGRQASSYTPDIFCLLYRRR